MMFKKSTSLYAAESYSPFLPLKIWGTAEVTTNPLIPRLTITTINPLFLPHHTPPSPHATHSTIHTHPPPQPQPHPHQNNDLSPLQTTNRFQRPRRPHPPPLNLRTPLHNRPPLRLGIPLVPRLFTLGQGVSLACSRRFTRFSC